MIHQAFEAQRMLFEPVRDMARWAIAAFGPAIDGMDQHPGREFLASRDLIARAGLTHRQPPCGIDSVTVDSPPNFLQRTAFMTMNQHHVKAYLDLHGHIAAGEADKAHSIRTVHDEYVALLDLTAGFYLDTIEGVPVRAVGEGRADLSRPAGQSSHHCQDGPARRRGRTRRHLRARRDSRSAQAPHGPRAVTRASSHAAGRQPLRRVQRLPM